MPASTTHTMPASTNGQPASTTTYPPMGTPPGGTIPPPPGFWSWEQWLWYTLNPGPVPQFPYPPGYGFPFGTYPTVVPGVGVGYFDQGPATSPVLPISGIGLEDRACAVRVLGTMVQLVALSQIQPRAWSSQDQKASTKVASDTRNLANSSEQDVRTLLNLISDRQQDVDTAYLSMLPTWQIDPQVKAVMVNGFRKHGGLSQMSLEALNQFANPELRAAIFDSGKTDFSWHQAACYASAAGIGASLVGAPGIAVALAEGMVFGGCFD